MNQTDKIKIEIYARKEALRAYEGEGLESLILFSKELSKVTEEYIAENEEITAKLNSRK